MGENKENSKCVRDIIISLVRAKFSLKSTIFGNFFSVLPMFPQNYPFLTSLAKIVLFTVILHTRCRESVKKCIETKMLKNKGFLEEYP